MVSAIFEAAVLVFFIAGIAMPAGVGGGLLYVPLLLMLHVVPTGNAAAALSQPIVFGAALAGNIFNLADQCRKVRKQRQSEGADAGESHYLIDPRVVIALLTPCLAGVIVGAILNQLLPELSILSLLLVVIIWSLSESMQKAMAMWKKESAAKATATAATAAAEAAVATTTPGLSSSGGAVAAIRAESEDKALRVQEQDVEKGVSDASSALSASSDSIASSASEPAAAATSASDVAVTEARTSSAAVDWIKVLSVWVFLLVVMTLRGAKLGDCSWGYWSISAVAFLVLLGASLVFRHPELATSKMVAVGCLSAVAGIGGGVVLNPMMLRAGFDAPRGSANVSVVVLLNSVIATFTFVLAGAIDPTHMAVLSTVSFCGSLLGKIILGWAIARTGRTSLLVFLLCAFMVIACVMILFEGSISFQQAIEHPDLRAGFFDLHRLCPQ